MTNGVFTDPAGNELKTGIDWGIARPGDAIRGARFANPDGWETSNRMGNKYRNVG